MSFLKYLLGHNDVKEDIDELLEEKVLSKQMLWKARHNKCETSLSTIMEMYESVRPKSKSKLLEYLGTYIKRHSRKNQGAEIKTKETLKSRIEEN